MLEWMDRPHRRLNPLTGEWVLVSPHRAKRPWQGQMESPSTPAVLPYDPECYLCPGNERAGGVRNPAYRSTFVFDNDFPALLPGVPSHSTGGLFTARSERGICRVVCFSPRHDLTIPGMTPPEMDAVVGVWCSQEAELRAIPWVRYVQSFENRGAIMGASNPHPHGQIWASESVPNELVKEANSQSLYFREHNACVLCDYIAAERSGERLIHSNDSFSALVPFWAVWPFEVLIVSSRHAGCLNELSALERRDLGAILQDVTRRYDALFGVPFPYSMGFHICPSGALPEAWHLHAHFYPPLLRSATVRKFMVGYEMLANAQRDVTPEAAAALLRAFNRSE
jgi:UDPglucose--hexose-1-phosphate uridylyltransferase